MSATTSVRKIIADFQSEITGTQSELFPQRAAEMLTKTAAIIGNINANLRNCRMDYNRVKRNHFLEEKKANRAKLLAETDDTYKRFLEALDVKEEAIELIRSLKYFLKEAEDEKRTAKFQRG